MVHFEISDWRIVGFVNLFYFSEIYLQIPQCTCPISHNVPFWTEMYTSLFEWCIGEYRIGALWELRIYFVSVKFEETVAFNKSEDVTYNILAIVFQDQWGALGN